jgi:hypothetical protein
MARRKMESEIRSKVAGVIHDDPISGRIRQEPVRRYVRPGTRLIAEREPDNPYGEGHAVRLILEHKGRLSRKVTHTHAAHPARS